MRLGVAHTIFLEWRTRYFLESPIHRIDRFEPVSRRFAPKSLLKAPVRTTVRIGVTGSPVRATMKFEAKPNDSHGLISQDDGLTRKKSEFN